MHSLVLTDDGAHALIGLEFENRCPAIVRIELMELAAIIDATLGGTWNTDEQVHLGAQGAPP